MDTTDQTDIDLNTAILHDLLSKGTSKSAVAKDLGISVHNLNRNIKELRESQGVLLEYRDLQNLKLTSIQAQILDSITPEKIESASLVELVSAFKVLKDKELVITGKATSITGLVGYLVQLEKEELRKIVDVNSRADEYEDAVIEDILPNL